MSELRNRVARRPAGDDPLYWRRREFAYPSQSGVDSTPDLLLIPAHEAGFAAEIFALRVRFAEPRALT